MPTVIHIVGGVSLSIYTLMYTFPFGKGIRYQMPMSQDARNERASTLIRVGNTEQVTLQPNGPLHLGAFFP